MLFEIEDGVLKRYKGNKKQVVIPNEVLQIGEGAFSHNHYIKSVVLPTNLAEIGNKAFFCCFELKKIVFPEKLAKIGEYAFSGCGAESINLPSSLSAIDDYAFHNCRELKSICIPESTAHIGKGVFSDCDLLDEIIVRKDNSVYRCKNGMLYDNNRILKCGVGAEGALSVSDGISVIDEGAFKRCRSIKKIFIPESVKQIGSCAFEDCSELEEVIFCSNAENTFNIDYNDPPEFADKGLKIEKYAFRKCTSLKKIDLPENTFYIGEEAFEDCIAVICASLYSNVEVIEIGVFNNCPSLNEIAVKENVDGFRKGTFIKDGMLANGENLIKCLRNTAGKIKTPSAIKTIKPHTFSDCAELDEIILNRGLKFIDYDAIENCAKLKRITIPASVERIYGSSITACPKLEQIDMPDASKNCFVTDGMLLSNNCLDYEDINDLVLVKCPAAKEGTVVVPKDVKIIGENAFENCRNITEIILPEGLIMIDSRAFEDCRSLKAIKLPQTLKAIPHNYGNLS